MEGEFPRNVRDRRSALPEPGFADHDRPEGHPFRNFSEAVIARHLKSLGASRNAIDSFLRDIRDDRFRVEDVQYRNANEMEKIMQDAVSEEGTAVRLSILLKSVIFLC